MHVHKYVVRLTGHEKRELRHLKRRAKTEARLADRARILLWAHDSVTIDETATRLDCGRDKVILWRRRFLEGRAAKLPVVERLRDQPRSGRPPTFSPTATGDRGVGDAGSLSDRASRGSDGL
jgi:hypothetical protein